MLEHRLKKSVRHGGHCLSPYFPTTGSPLNPLTPRERYFLPSSVFRLVVVSAVSIARCPSVRFSDIDPVYRSDIHPWVAHLSKSPGVLFRNHTGSRPWLLFPHFAGNTTHEIHTTCWQAGCSAATLFPSYRTSIHQNTCVERFCLCQERIRTATGRSQSRFSAGRSRRGKTAGRRDEGRRPHS